MASSANSVPRQEVNALLRQVQGNTLFNRQLTSICQVNGLKSTGVKAELQRRIIDLIQDAVNHDDVSRFQQIRQSIANAITQRWGTSRVSPARTSGSSSQRPAPSSMPASMPQLGGLGGPRTAPLAFKPSPFYQVEHAVSSLNICDAMAQHRNSCIISIKMSDHPILQRCVDDKQYRVMVFCAGDSGGVQDIAFPHQAELKVNGDEVKANLRGVKNKPGSTRPVDITHALHLRTNYTNKVEFTYALTTKAGGHHLNSGEKSQRFYLLINLCKVNSVPDLVKKVSDRRKIPKASVVAELREQAQDPDVVAMSQVLSLKCPLSQMRLQVPCRSLSCTHIQCFDATSYLQLQEQGPQWLCPTCNKSAPFEQLAVDEYVRDILENTPSGLETVTIEPDGRWTSKSSQEETCFMPSRASLADDDDDDLEVSEISVKKGFLLDSPRRITPSTNTPTSTGRDGSSGTPRSIPPTSAKRPASAVIDLTISSDEEDDEPIRRPNKRQKVRRAGHRGSETGFYRETSTEDLS